MAVRRLACALVAAVAFGSKWVRFRLLHRNARKEPTPRPTIVSIDARPLSIASAETSYNRVSYPAAMAACAIPWPIVPAPSTAMRLIMIGVVNRAARSAVRDP
jgi:hypothetical protein